MNVEISYDSALLTKTQHDSMKSWHASMATQHAIAAEWHSDQSGNLSKAIQNIPLDPEKIVSALFTERGASTATAEAVAVVSAITAPVISTQVRTASEAGASTAQGGGSAPRPVEVPLDPVKKADLVEILKQHVDEYGSFHKSIEDVVEIILGR